MKRAGEPDPDAAPAPPPKIPRHHRRHRHRSPTPSYSSSSSSSDSDEERGTSRRQRFLLQAQPAAPFGLREGQMRVDEPRILDPELTRRQPHGDGYARNEAMQIVDELTGALVVDLESRYPFRPGLYRNLAERSEIWGQNKDYRFMQILAYKLQKPIAALMDEETMRNVQRAEKEFEATRKYTLESMKRDITSLQAEQQRARAALDRFLQEENLIRGGIIEPIDRWWTSHQLRSWLQIEDWLMPFYYRWQYRWVDQTLLQPNYRFGENEEDYLTMRTIGAVDKRLFRTTLDPNSIIPNYPQLNDWMRHPERARAFIETGPAAQIMQRRRCGVAAFFHHGWV